MTTIHDVFNSKMEEVFVGWKNEIFWVTALNAKQVFASKEHLFVIVNSFYLTVRAPSLDS